MTEDQIQEKAREIVAFKQHLTTYVLIISLLFVLDWWDNDRIDWAYYPALGWGIGILAHAMNTYGFGFLSVEKEAAKLREKYNK